MRLQLGCPVSCSDGEAGELVDVVIDPFRRRVTHLVVEPHHTHRLARLVPVRLASPGVAPGTLDLGCTTGELDQMEHVDDFAYLRLDEFPVHDPEWDIGIETVLLYPDPMDAGFGVGPTFLDPHVALRYHRIPRGETELRRSSSVLSHDGHRIGHVDGFLVDTEERITHVVLERGHVFGRRQVTVPVGAVQRVVNDSITLNLTKEAVAELPAVGVDTWRSRIGHRRAPVQAGPQLRAS